MKAECQRMNTFYTVELEKTLKSPLDSKEIKQVNPKGNQSWTFTGKNDAEAEIFHTLPHDVKSRLTEKDPAGGKDWRQEEKGVADDGLVREPHWFNGHESGHTLWNREGWGSLACCNPWSHRIRHDSVTEQHYFIAHVWIVLWDISGFSFHIPRPRSSSYSYVFIYIMKLNSANYIIIQILEKRMNHLHSGE